MYVCTYYRNYIGSTPKLAVSLIERNTWSGSLSSSEQGQKGVWTAQG